MVSKVTYKGDLRCEAIHLRSQTQIESDAPVDNEGLGERFSPTDTVATSLATCMFTIMGIKARSEGWDLLGMQAERISGIDIAIHMPAQNWSERQKKVLENSARTCPVAMSLHPDIEVNLEINWAAPQPALPA
jgi:uncharacterized OsmC-like protein